MSDRFRTLIVDDERLSRQRLKRMLADDPEIDVIAECGGGEEAISAVRSSSPAIVFLDVEMPETDGFAVLDAMTAPTPAVVFVTAHAHYAVRAFDAHAIDYLMKPFDKKRLARAVARAKERLRQKDGTNLAAELRGVLERARQARPSERIVVREGEKAVFVKVGDIEWIDAESNYARLHVGRTSHLVRESLSALADRLDASQFRRIHKSTIVNVDAIRELHTWFHGDYRVLLKSGAELKLSRNYRKNCEDLLP